MTSPLDLPKLLTGQPVGQVLPTTVDGALVVAATCDGRLVSLASPVIPGARIAPVTVASWEGRRIFRTSVGLLLLEAARRLWPGVVLRLGPRRNEAQLVIGPPVDAAMLVRAMHALVEEGRSIREEIWSLEEARQHLRAQGWDEAAELLTIRREHLVPMARCGDTVVLGMGPLVSDTRRLAGFALRPHEAGLLLDFGATIRPHTAVLTSAIPRVDRHALEVRHTQARMSAELDTWLGAVDVRSVGAFNRACIAGRVDELVRVSEGFHEKHVGRVADAIVARTGTRVVAIAGPSSSGKSTFIQRLRVQLEVNGLRPAHLSLDDYYLDRARTPRDAAGEYDFESTAALDRALLDTHLARLVAGEPVKTARYDFGTGLSAPEGGPELALGANGILLVEGLHALAPGLLDATGTATPPFRVFVHPATALPFDRLSGVLPEDLRLVRRIVRDRHTRGYTASESIQRWPAVRRGEEQHVFTCLPEADMVFDSSLVYELAALRVYAERYLLEVTADEPAYPTAVRLRQLLDHFVPIHPDHVPPTSILREFIGGSSFDGG